MSAYAWGANTAQTNNTTTPKRGTASPGSDKKDLSAGSTNGLAKNLLLLLQVCLLAVLGLVIWLNIQPYIGMMHELLGNQGRHPLILFVMNLPIIGSLLNLIKSVFLSILGILLWGLFQIIELMPSVMNSNNGLRNMLFGLSNHRKMAINNDDPELIRRMKVRYNRKPQTWMMKATLAASIAYLTDFAFCLFYYPPIEGGLKNLFIFMAAPSADQIDVRNLVLALVTLFSVEVSVWIYMWMIEGRQYLLGKKA